MLRRHARDAERSGPASDYASLLRQMATILATNAHDLAGLLERLPTSEDQVNAMRARDRRGARLDRQLGARLASSYMVPFHREDLHALAEGLTDVIDDLGHGAELLVVLQPAVIPDQLVAHSRVVADAADQARELISQLPAGRVERTLADIDRLEREGDAIFRQALGWLFSGAHDDLDVTRWKDILEVLEHALNGIEKVADIVEAMLIRHG
jgi:hypothetical protein